MCSSAILPLEKTADAPTRRSLCSKISLKLPLAVKSPAQSLDYRANSYHIHLNTLRFHGCGKEISQIWPCPFCPINTSLSGTLLPSYHSTGSNPPSWRWHCSRTSRTPISSFLREEMAINFVVPEVNLPSPSFYSFAVLLFICKFVYWVLLFSPFSSFLVPSNFKPSRS